MAKERIKKMSVDQAFDTAKEFRRRFPNQSFSISAYIFRSVMEFERARNEFRWDVCNRIINEFKKVGLLMEARKLKDSIEDNS